MTLPLPDGSVVPKRVDSTRGQLEEHRKAFESVQRNIDEISMQFPVQPGNMARTAEAWHEVGAVGEPAFQNGWSNFGGAHATAGFYRHGERVYLRGLVGGGTSDVPIFTLPAGYRPAMQELFGVYATGAVGRIDISATGSVALNGGSNGHVSLNGISFRVAD